MKATESCRRNKRRITLCVLISLSILLGIISLKPRVKKVVLWKSITNIWFMYIISTLNQYNIYSIDIGLQGDLNDHLEVLICYYLEPDIFPWNVICVFRNCGKGTKSIGGPHLPATNRISWSCRLCVTLHEKLLGWRPRTKTRHSLCSCEAEGDAGWIVCLMSYSSFWFGGRGWSF